MAAASGTSRVRHWDDAIGRWTAIWGLPGFEKRLRITVSTRLRTSLGRCSPDRNEIRIAAFVADSPDRLLNEVLCHEAAHAVAHELHGPRIRPHGSEWRGLMECAGFEPRARIPLHPTDAPSAHANRRRIVWEHRCPVCQAMRAAGRPVRQWRCAACRANGLAGELVVTRTTVGESPP